MWLRHPAQHPEVLVAGRGVVVEVVPDAGVGGVDLLDRVDIALLDGAEEPLGDVVEGPAPAPRRCARPGPWWLFPLPWRVDDGILSLGRGPGVHSAPERNSRAPVLVVGAKEGGGRQVELTVADLLQLPILREATVLTEGSYDPYRPVSAARCIGRPQGRGDVLRGRFDSIVASWSMRTPGRPSASCPVHAGAPRRRGFGAGRGPGRGPGRRPVVAAQPPGSRPAPPALLPGAAGLPRRRGGGEPPDPAAAQRDRRWPAGPSTRSAGSWPS